MTGFKMAGIVGPDLDVHLMGQMGWMLGWSPEITIYIFVLASYPNFSLNVFEITQPLQPFRRVVPLQRYFVA